MFLTASIGGFGDMKGVHLLIGERTPKTNIHMDNACVLLFLDLNSKGS
jgi:hypothetical protein